MCWKGSNIDVRTFYLYVFFLVSWRAVPLLGGEDLGLCLSADKENPGSTPAWKWGPLSFFFCLSATQWRNCSQVPAYGPWKWQLYDTICASWNTVDIPNGLYARVTILHQKPKLKTRFKKKKKKKIIQQIPALGWGILVDLFCIRRHRREESALRFLIFFLRGVHVPPPAPIWRLGTREWTRRTKLVLTRLTRLRAVDGYASDITR